MVIEKLNAFINQIWYNDIFLFTFGKSFVWIALSVPLNETDASKICYQSYCYAEDESSDYQFQPNRFKQIPQFSPEPASVEGAQNIAERKNLHKHLPHLPRCKLIGTAKNADKCPSKQIARIEYEWQSEDIAYPHWGNSDKFICSQQKRQCYNHRQMQPDNRRESYE